MDEPTTDTRLYAVPVVSGGSRAGTVVVGLDLEPYERTASRAFLASLIFAAVVLVLIALTVRWVIGRALRPVAQMTADAEAWTEHDLDHRFDVGEPHDELTHLAATFDRMLARLSASLRREQRFSAELSHELRTPLSAIVAEVGARASPRADDAGYRDALAEIAERARQLQRTLDALLAAARAESAPEHGSADAVSVAEFAIESCAPLAALNHVDLELDQAADGPARGRRARRGRTSSGPHPRQRLSLRPQPSDRRGEQRPTGTVDFMVTDDGPGVDPGERELRVRAG